MSGDKKLKGIAFGRQSQRFDIAQVHPKWRLPGSMIQTSSDSHLGPGSYIEAAEHLSDFSSKNLQKKASGPNWRRAWEMERLSQMPHLLCKDLWEQKQLEKTKLGPGSYDVPDSWESGTKMAGKSGPLSSLEPRFKENSKFETPAPGIYGKGGVPHALKEEAEIRRKTGGTVGILENGGNGQRTLPVAGCNLGPGTYQLKSSVDSLTDKVTGTRGPYDVFSLDRNKPIMTGHFAKIPSHKIGPGQYEVQSFIKDMNAPEKRNHGKFMQNIQYPSKPHDRVYWYTLSQCPRDPNIQVSPASYSPSKTIFERQSYSAGDIPFNSSSKRVDRRALAFFTGNFNPVGAGRYDIQKYNDIQHVNSHMSIFNSKSNARTSNEEKAILKERLREKNMPEKSKYRVDHVPTEAAPYVDLRPVFNSSKPLIIA